MATEWWQLPSNFISDLLNRDEEEERRPPRASPPLGPWASSMQRDLGGPSLSPGVGGGGGVSSPSPPPTPPPGLSSVGQWATQPPPPPPEPEPEPQRTPPSALSSIGQWAVDEERETQPSRPYRPTRPQRPQRPSGPLAQVRPAEPPPSGGYEPGRQPERPPEPIERFRLQPPQIEPYDTGSVREGLGRIGYWATPAAQRREEMGLSPSPWLASMRRDRPDEAPYWRPPERGPDMFGRTPEDAYRTGPMDVMRRLAGGAAAGLGRIGQWAQSGRERSREAQDEIQAAGFMPGFSNQGFAESLELPEGMSLLPGDSVSRRLMEERNQEWEERQRRLEMGLGEPSMAELSEEMFGREQALTAPLWLALKGDEQHMPFARLYYDYMQYPGRKDDRGQRLQMDPLSVAIRKDPLGQEFHRGIVWTGNWLQAVADYVGREEKLEALPQPGEQAAAGMTHLWALGAGLGEARRQLTEDLGEVGGPTGLSQLFLSMVGPEGSIQAGADYYIDYLRDATSVVAPPDADEETQYYYDTVNLLAYGGTDRMEPALQRLINHEEAAGKKMYSAGWYAGQAMDPSLSDEERLGHMIASAELGRDAYNLLETKPSSVLDANRNIWGELAVDVIFDPLEWGLGGLLKGAGITSKALRVGAETRRAEDLAKLSVEEVARMLANAQDEALAQKGQEVLQKGGFNPLKLFDLTPESRALQDRNALYQQAASIVGQAETVGDAKTLLRRWANAEENWLTNYADGLNSEYVSHLTSVADVPMVGPRYFATEEAMESRRTLVEVAEWIDQLGALQGEENLVMGTAGKMEVMEQLSELFRVAAWKKYGLTKDGFAQEIPTAAVQATVKELDDGTALVQFKGPGGTVIEETPVKTLDKAKEYARRANASGAESKSRLQQITDMQRGLMSTVWLNVRPGHWMRNAMSALGHAFADDTLSFAKVNDIDNYLGKMMGGTPVTGRIGEGTAGLEDYISGQSSVGKIPGFGTLYRKSGWEKLDQWASYQWTGDTNILGRIPWGEAAHYKRNFYRVFRETIEKEAPRSIRQSLGDAGLLDLPGGERVANALAHAWQTGGRDGYVYVVDDVVDNLRVAFDPKAYNIDSELADAVIDPETWNRIGEAARRYQGQSAEAFLSEVRRIFYDDSRTVRRNHLTTPPQHGRDQFTTIDEVEDFQNYLESIDVRGRKAGLPEEEIAERKQQAQELVDRILPQRQELEEQLLDVVGDQSPVKETLDTVVGAWEDVWHLQKQYRTEQAKLFHDVVVRDDFQGRAWRQYFDEMQQLVERTYQDQMNRLLLAVEDVQTGNMRPRQFAGRSLDRYMQFDQEEVRRAMELQPGSAAEDTDTLQRVIDANRAIVDQEEARLLHILRAYPSRESLDVMFSLQRQRNGVYSAVVEMVADARDEARRIADESPKKAKQAWRDFYEKRNEMWRAGFEADRIRTESARYEIAELITTDEARNALRWQMNPQEAAMRFGEQLAEAGQDVRLVRPVSVNRARMQEQAQDAIQHWKVRLADGTELFLPENDIPGNVLQAYRQAAQNITDTVVKRGRQAADEADDLYDMARGIEFETDVLPSDWPRREDIRTRVRDIEPDPAAERATQEAELRRQEIAEQARGIEPGEADPRATLWQEVYQFNEAREAAGKKPLPLEMKSGRLMDNAILNWINSKMDFADIEDLGQLTARQVQEVIGEWRRLSEELLEQAGEAVGDVAEDVATAARQAIEAGEVPEEIQQAMRAARQGAERVRENLRRQWYADPEQKARWQAQVDEWQQMLDDLQSGEHELWQEVDLPAAGRRADDDAETLVSFPGNVGLYLTKLLPDYVWGETVPEYWNRVVRKNSQAYKAANAAAPTVSDMTQYLSTEQRILFSRIAENAEDILQGTAVTWGPEELQRLRNWMVQEGMPLYEDTVQTAARAATRVADFTMLDYSKRRHWDTMLNFFVPYHYWHTRSAWNWLERSAMKPSILANFARVERAVDEHHQREDTPMRTSGRIPLGENPFRDTGTDLYMTNPMYYLFAYGSMIPHANFDDEQAQTWMKKVYDTMNMAGFSFFPHMDLGMRALIKTQEEELPFGEALQAASQDSRAWLPIPQLFTYGAEAFGLGRAGADRVSAPLRRSFFGRDQWSPYLYGRAVSFLHQDGQIPDDVAKWMLDYVAQQEGKLDGPLPEQPEGLEQYWPLVQQVAASDKLGQSGSNFGLGLGIMPYRDAEQELRRAGTEYGARLRSPQNPFGSKGAAGQTIEENPALTTYWGKSFFFADRLPNELRPGERASQDDRTQTAIDLYDQQAEKIEEITGEFPGYNWNQITEELEKDNLSSEQIQEQLDEQFPSAKRQEWSVSGASNWEIIERAFENLVREIDQREFPESPGQDEGYQAKADYIKEVADFLDQQAQDLGVATKEQGMSYYLQGMEPGEFLEARDVESMGPNQAKAQALKDIFYEGREGWYAQVEEEYGPDIWRQLDQAPWGSKDSDEWDEFKAANPDAAALLDTDQWAERPVWPFDDEYQERDTEPITDERLVKAEMGRHWDAYHAFGDDWDAKQRYLESNPDFLDHYIETQGTPWFMEGGGRRGRGQGGAGGLGSGAINSHWEAYRGLGDDWGAKAQYMRDNPDFARYYKAQGWSPWWENYGGFTLGGRFHQAFRPSYGGGGGYGRRGQQFQQRTPQVRTQGLPGMFWDFDMRGWQPPRDETWRWLQSGQQLRPGEMQRWRPPR